MGNYDAMTFAEAMLIVQGYNDRIIFQYKQTRLLMFMMAKMWGDAKKSPKSPEDLWPLPGDKVTKQMDNDEIAEMFRKLKEKEKGNE